MLFGSKKFGRSWQTSTSQSDGTLSERNTFDTGLTRLNVRVRPVDWSEHGQNILSDTELSNSSMPAGFC